MLEEYIKKWSFVKEKHIQGKKFYLYHHIRLDTNQVFYIGIGSMRFRSKYGRAITKTSRNTYWKNVFNKIDNYVILIVEESDSEEEIKALEIQHIKEFRDKGIKLCNLSNGGERNNHKDFLLSKEHMKKMKEKKSPMEGRRHNVETLAYFSECKKGCLNQMWGKKGANNPNSKPVAMYDLDGNILRYFENIRLASEFLGLCDNAVSKSIRKNHKCQGYIFKKLTNEEIQSVQFS